MRYLIYFLLILPTVLWSQELTVMDYITALDDVTAFKAKFFKAYPPNKETEPREIILVES